MKKYIGVTKPIRVVSEASANVDANYGPYSNVEEATSYIPKELRKLGLTVGIIINNKVVEYWWESGVSDSDLIVKTISSLSQLDPILDDDFFNPLLRSTKGNPLKVGDTWTNIISSVTGESVNYKEITKWFDGTPMTDDKVDGVMIRKRGDSYLSLVVGGQFTLNVLWFGADLTGVQYSNDAIRKALLFLTKIGGGALYFPSGNYLVKQEFDKNQPPLSALSRQNACFIVPANTTIYGDGKNSSRIKFECPGQAKGLVDESKFYTLFNYDENFEAFDLEILGTIKEDDFEFVPFWGATKWSAIFQHTPKSGLTIGKNVKIHDCRLGQLRGFAIGTAIMNKGYCCNNEFLYHNGVNLSGNGIICNYNTWYYCELIESAGLGISDADAVKMGFTQSGGTQFIGNICYECNGGALGGNTKPDPLEITYGYYFSDNILINNIVSTISGFSIANNALYVIISNNIIRGLFDRCLTVTEGGVKDCPPSDVKIIGGMYETTKTDEASHCIQIATEGKTYLNSVNAISKNMAFHIVGSEKADVYIQGGVVKARTPYSFASNSSARLCMSKDVIWLPSLEFNKFDPIANMGNTIGDVTHITPTFFVSKDKDGANKPIEIFRKYGGPQTDARFAYFIRYTNGRIGWGDPDTNNIADVWMSRVGPGVLGLDDGNCFRTGVFSDIRPDASVVGIGAMIYDKTLKKPIWSNGTTWVDAMGNVV